MPIVIGICGGTASGKTTLSEAIYRELGGCQNITFLHHDAYYRDITHLSISERGKTNFDHPDSLDTSLLIQHVKDLKKGSSVEVPNYDFTMHSRTKERTAMDAKPIILLEGILIFAEKELVDLMDVKVYVDVDADIRLMRRMERDMSERGRSSKQVAEQYSSTVRPMHDKFVEPSKKCADIIVHSAFNSVVLSMITNHLRMVVGDALE